ncbi:MAG: NAD(P)H-dependent oxidoreductase [Proteobacteria bacterium]|nr:NAD(P)H-dependent oxidoreductase [Pseudomonadota bacterium]
MTHKILFIIGSNRKQSFNRQLADKLIAMIGSRAECAILDYSAVPFLNQDAEYPAPEAITLLRETVAAADALWIITPEYNASYPGLLKNVLDWLSRPVVRNDYATPTVMRGKKATISGAAGKSAAAHARKKLAELLGFMGVQLFGEEGIGIALGGESFGSDKLIVSEDTQKALQAHVDNFLSFLA